MDVNQTRGLNVRLICVTLRLMCVTLRLICVTLRLICVTLRLIDVPSTGVIFRSTGAPALSSNQKIRMTDSDQVVFCLNVCPSKPCDQSC